MASGQPLVSIVMATYNRAHTIRRAIDSVMRQTYDNFELIIVDDGSKDETLEIVSKYADNRIKVLRHEVNRGVTAAKNTGFNAIRGEWFTLLDSDDEMVPEALETLLSVPDKTDRTITAVTCNCRDSVHGDFSGHGLTGNGYLNEQILIEQCTGEFWGITRTNLLGKDRFNESLPGWENVLWYKINSRANRYYLHQALRIYHTEGDDKVTKKQRSQEGRALDGQWKIFKALTQERQYLLTIHRYKPLALQKLCIKGMVVSASFGDTERFSFYQRLYSENVRGLSPLAVIVFLSRVSGMKLNRFLFRLLFSGR